MLKKFGLIFCIFFVIGMSSLSMVAANSDGSGGKGDTKGVPNSLGIDFKEVYDKGEWINGIHTGLRMWGMGFALTIQVTAYDNDGMQIGHKEGVYTVHSDDFKYNFPDGSQRIHVRVTASAVDKHWRDWDIYADGSHYGGIAMNTLGYVPGTACPNFFIRGNNKPKPFDTGWIWLNGGA
jgi:hypothetical protein